MHLGPQFSSVCTINSNLSPKVLVATRKQRVDITGVSVGTLVGRGGVLGYVLCCYDLVRRREWTEINGALVVKHWLRTVTRRDRVRR